MLRRSPRVLVVEDDQKIRDLVTDALAENGIKVDAARDGLTALDKLDADDYDVIVADAQLPGGIGGVDTVRCARVNHPSLRSLFISSEDKPNIDEPDDEVVIKPFSVRELVGCVWELYLRHIPGRRITSNVRLADRSIAAAKVDCLRRQRRASWMRGRSIKGTVAAQQDHTCS